MRYERPETITDATRLLAGAAERAFVLAGGTDLLVRMKNDDFEAELVVDIKAISGMTDITQTEDGFVIGAAVPCAALGEHKALSAAWPGVVEAANLIGSTQIQGRCTVVGNLCNASPAADSVPALVAAGAHARVAGPEGTRTVAVEDIPLSPGKTSLKKGELIEAILLNAPQENAGDAYLRFIPRTEMDIAVVGDPEGKIEKARVALGAVGPKVALAEEAAACLVGTKLEDAALDALAEACCAACTPIDDKRGTIDFRKQVSGVLARRAARIAYDRAGVSTTINGDDVEYLCQPDETLLDVLRNRLGLMGSKEGCGTGDCGACSTIMDGRVVCSCLVLGAEADGRNIETIEGMAKGSDLHPLQAKFIEHAALQCGICTPGFLVAAKALLDANPNPTETEIRFWLAGNLCRCTGYDKIVRAVQDAALEMRGEKA